MSSRNPPSNPGDSRYVPRDRSPPRFPERRPSAVYSSTPLAARITDPVHRSNDSLGYSSVGREPPREPPRGPKALLDGSRPGRYGSRARAFAGRGESRDSDYRDITDGSIARRGLDRDWSRIDNRERRISPAGRNRSRSPIPRDFRDSRDFATRDADTNRVRRGSREGPLSANSLISDALPSASFSNMGTYRGRGRGSWEYSRSSRGIYPEDRDLFRNRSRSRDRIWEKKGRDEKDFRDADLRDQEAGRRDDDSKKERDERERDVDKHWREAGGFRSDSRNSTATQVTPSTPISASAVSTHQHNADRTTQNTRAASVESNRRPSGSTATSTIPGNPRDSDRNDLLHSRSERDRQVPRISPPPQAPQVPAFGSIIYRASPTSQSGGVTKDRSKDNMHSTLKTRSSSFDTAKEASLAPKAKILNAGGNPKQMQLSDRPVIENLGVGSRRSENDRDRYRSSNLFDANSNNSGDMENFKDSTDSTSNIPSQFNGPIEYAPKASQVPSKQKSLQSLQPSLKRDIDNPSHHHNTTSNLHSTPHKTLLHDNASQSSPIKIPTGPRAERSAPTIRQPGSPPLRGAPTRPSIPQRQPRPGNLKWVRPGLPQPGLPQPSLPQHTPRGPSIMNIVPTKRDYVGEEKRSVHADRDPLKPVELSWPRHEPHAKEESHDQGHAEREQGDRAETEMDSETIEDKLNQKVINEKS